MTLDQYMAKNKVTSADFAKAAKVSIVTVNNIRRGLMISKYGVAKAISAATKGAVSIDDICR
jgi:DNA-binding XRE family transcriptional regulator